MKSINATVHGTAYRLGKLWGASHDDPIPEHDLDLVKLLNDNKDISEIYLLVAWRGGYSRGYRLREIQK